MSMAVDLHESRTTIARQQHLLAELMSRMDILFQSLTEAIEAVETVEGLQVD